MDTSITNNTRQGNDADVAQLITDMKFGKIGAVIINNSNPIYTLPNAEDFIYALSKVELSVAFSSADNETVNAVDYAFSNTSLFRILGNCRNEKRTV